MQPTLDSHSVHCFHALKLPAANCATLLRFAPSCIVAMFCPTFCNCYGLPSQTKIVESRSNRESLRPNGESTRPSHQASAPSAPLGLPTRPNVPYGTNTELSMSDVVIGATVQQSALGKPYSLPHSRSSSPGTDAARASTAGYMPSIPSLSLSMPSTPWNERDLPPHPSGSRAPSYVNVDADLSQQSRPPYASRTPDISPRPGSARASRTPDMSLRPGSARAPSIYINGTPNSTAHSPSPHTQNRPHTLRYGAPGHYPEK